MAKLILLLILTFINGLVQLERLTGLFLNSLSERFIGIKKKNALDEYLRTQR